MTLTFWLPYLAGAYLIGAVPFGLLLGKLKGVDIREHGSGNVGATNAGRVLGKAWGITCFVLDVAKGLGPVLGFGFVAGLIAGSTHGAIPTLQWFAVAAAAVLGHVFPIYLKFKGGKGVATGFGVLLGMFPVLTAAGAAAAITWLIVMRTTAYVSLASIIAAGAMPLFALGLAFAFGRGGGEIAVYVGITALLAALVVVRHRSNIRRLMRGEEAKAAWASRPATTNHR